MNSTKKLPISIFLFLCLSCTLLIDPKDRQQLKLKDLKESKEIICSLTNKIELMGPSQKAIKSFKRLLSKLNEDNVKLTSTEIFVLWSLHNSYTSPHLTSPTARLQVFTKRKADIDYQDFYTSERTNNAYPFYFGLEKILHKEDNSRTLQQLIKLYMKNNLFNDRVDPTLHSFLTNNQEQIFHNKTLKQHYFRGPDILKKGEYLPKPQLLESYRFYQDHFARQDYKKVETLFEFKTKWIDTQVQCNYDLELYKDSMFYVSDDFIRSNLFGIKINTDIILASTNQIINFEKSLLKTPYFFGNSSHRATPLCHAKSLQEQTDLTLLSTESRDPTQHLYHLFQYNISQITSVEELEKILRFSRHLFLVKPLRLAYESHRGTQEQLNNLLKISIPLYHSENLGKIWGHYKGKDQDYFFIDDRAPGSLSCFN